MMLAYVFVALSRPPQRDLLGKHLPRIDEMLKKQDDTALKTFGNPILFYLNWFVGFVMAEGMDVFVLAIGRVRSS